MIDVVPLQALVGLFKNMQRRGFWRKMRWLGCGLILGCGLLPAWADEDDEEEDTVPPALKEWGRKFSGVKEWQGIWEVSITGAASRATAGGNMESRYEASAHGTFLLKRLGAGDGDWRPRQGVLTWRGEGEATGRGYGTYSEWEKTYGVGEEWQQEFRGTMAQKDVEFALWFGNKSRLVSLHPGTYDNDKVPKMKRTGHALALGSGSGRTLVNHPIDQTLKAPVDTWYLGVGDADSARRWNDVAGGPGVLVFTHESATSGRNQKFEISGAGIRQRSRVFLIPVHDNLEVAVTIEGYAEWRPKGTIADPKKPGNALVARATLRNKDGSPAKDLPPVRRFTFELLDTSREPGICLNWPLDAKDRDLDMKLTTAATGGDISKEDQKLVVKDPPNDDAQRPYADTKIESYDFGGKANLMVICELEDGREIVGLLKDEKGNRDLVRIPKMDGPGWVAESWRKEHDVLDLPDNHDDEEVKGQEHKGDGFTLYEEYRGFVHNGKHLSGDPKEKDFFILNLGDVRTRSGIALFERLSKLRVHSRLKDGVEMTQQARLMNGNHRDGPHRVNQHGVVLSHVGMGKGGNTIGVEGADGSKNFRPRYVNWIFVEEPDAQRGLFSAANRQDYGVDHANVKRLYAAAVAHELLHAIGADHHGEWQMQVRWAYFQGAQNPVNPTKQNRFTDSWGPGPSYFQSDGKRGWEAMDRGDTLTLLWEDTRENLLAERAAAFGAELDKQREHLAGGNYVADTAKSLARLGKGEDFWREYLAHDSAESGLNFRMFVGKYQGTDSGNESCVMRYYFATAHEDRQKKNSFFVIRPGTKQPAIGICTGAEGTGGNAPSHQPQSRFGPAASGRGNCFDEVCPNDAIPVRSIVIQ